MSEKIVSEIFSFVSMLFLIFEKATRKKTVPRVFRFEKTMKKKLCQVFRDLEVCFFNI